MCEFCMEHGDGKIWYTNAKNYADDLMSDLTRRHYFEDFFESTIQKGFTSLGRLETIYQKKKKLPARIINSMVRKAKKEHFGQVVPMEDIRTIVSKAATVVRMPCACRWASHRKETRCCYCVSYSAETWYENLNMSYFGEVSYKGLESVTREEAVSQMERLEDKKAVHTIWTMMTPFIGALCNCSTHECLGLRALAMQVETLARGEQVAIVDDTLCDGCGFCAEFCQFNAISGQQVHGETIAVVQPNQCFGCGLCRNCCPQKAITLSLRV